MSLVAAVSNDERYGLQVEGAFVFGLGMMLQESVSYSPEGQPTYDSTWDYKIPSAACIPRQLNIALLEANQLHTLISS